jgi:hypothetical protein
MGSILCVSPSANSWLRISYLRLGLRNDEEKSDQTDPSGTGFAVTRTKEYLVKRREHLEEGRRRCFERCVIAWHEGVHEGPEQTAAGIENFYGSGEMR